MPQRVLDHITKITELKNILEQLENLGAFLSMATNWILKTSETSKAETTAVAVPYLRLLGLVSGGWLLIKSAVIAYQQENSKKLSPNFQRKKILSAQFFVDLFVTTHCNMASLVEVPLAVRTT